MAGRRWRHPLGGDPYALQRSLNLALGKARGEQYVRNEVHVMPVMEEPHLKRVLEHVRSYADRVPGALPRTMHVGVAGWFNLEVLAQGKHDYVLLMDTNMEQSLFWKDMVQLLAENESPMRLRAVVKDRMTAQGKWKLPDGQMLELRSERNEIDFGLLTMEWLKDKQHYARVHEAAKEGRILTADANIYDRERLGAMRRWCDANQMAVTSIYASNIEDMNKDQPSMRTVTRIMPVRDVSGNVQRVVDNLKMPVQGKLHTPPRDFYGNPFTRDSAALKQLANDERCQIFHSNATNLPLLILEGQWPLLESTGHARY